jgi:TatD DNase family protein
MLGRAAAVGVDTVVAVSVDLASAHATVRLADRTWPARVIPAVGVHPVQPHLFPSEDAWRQLAHLAEQDVVGAIGECGVDDASPTEPRIQLATLERLGGLAARLDRPLLLHMRGTALIEAALDAIATARCRGVVHYFVGDAALAARYLARGLLIAVGKPVTRPENATLRDAIAGIPIDRLLLETDTYPVAGRTTEPADTRLVAGAIAELRGITVEEVAGATSDNLERLLGRQGSPNRAS